MDGFFHQVLWDGADDVLRILIVGPLLYLALLVALRISGKRSLAQYNAFDYVITVALGSLLATTVLSEEAAVAEGVLAIALLLALQFLVSFTGARSGRFRKVVANEPALLVRRGRVLEQTLRRQRVARAELYQALRSEGLASPAQAELVVLETDGSMSVLPAGTDPLAEARRKGPSQ